MLRRIGAVPILLILSVCACGGGDSSGPGPVPDPVLPTTSVADALPFQKTFSRRAGTPVRDEVELAPLQQSQLKELTVRISNGSGAPASDGSVEIAGVSVLSTADFPLTEKVVKVNIGTARPIRLVTTIAGVTGGSFNVRVDAGSPVTASGGSIDVAGGAVKIAVPSGAVAGALSISAEPLTRGANDDFLDGYGFGPSGTTFSKPITLTFPAPTVAAGIRPLLFWRQTKTDRWTPLTDTRFDPVARTVSGSISHFTEVAVRVGEVLVCPNQPDAAPTLAAGVALAPEGGVVRLCDAEHVIATPVTIAKALTITSIDGARARVTTTTPGAALIIGDFASDSVVLSAFDVTSSSGLLSVGDRARNVRVSDVTVRLPVSPSAGFAVSIATNSRSGALTTVARSRFAGGSGGVSVTGAATAVVVDNTFDDTQVAVRFQSSGAARPRGTVARNSFARCAGPYCVAGGDADSLDVVQNSFTIGSPIAIGVSARIARILNNTIGTVQALTGGAADTSSYPFSGGIEVTGSALHAVIADISGNRIGKTGRALIAARATTTNALDVSVVGSDNVFDEHAYGIETRHGALLFLSRNDFLRTGRGSIRELNAVSGRATLLNNGSDLSCNWWGNSIGPVSVTSSPIAFGSAVYTVVAGAPIAGTSTGCAASQIRVCPGTVGAVSTVAEGVTLVAANGIVRLCDAVHVISDTIRINKPLTITSYPGVRARIQSTTPVFSFLVEGFSTDSVMFSNVAATVRGFVNGRTRYPNIRVEDVQITADRIINPLFFQANSNTNSLVTVSRSRFSDGQAQVNTTVGSRRIVLSDNDFAGAGFANLLLQGAQSVVRGNRFTDCVAVGCILISQGESAEIVGNRLSGRSVGTNTRLIVAATRVNIISDNIIESSLPLSGPAFETTSYPFADAIVVLGSTAFPVYASITGNRLDGVSRGILVAPSGDETRGVTVEGRDNRINRAGYGLDVRDGAVVRLTLNDFTAVGIAGVTESNATPARSTMSANGSSIACNWWGSANGPLGIGTSPVVIPPSVFTPIRTAPVAGTGATCGN